MVSSGITLCTRLRHVFPHPIHSNPLPIPTSSHFLMVPCTVEKGMILLYQPTNQPTRPRQCAVINQIAYKLHYYFLLVMRAIIRPRNPGNEPEPVHPSVGGDRTGMLVSFIVRDGHRSRGSHHRAGSHVNHDPQPDKLVSYNTSSQQYTHQKLQ